MDTARQDQRSNAKDAASRFSRTEAFLRQLIETIPTPIYYKDAQGRYRWGNTAWAKNILGLPLKEIIGRTVYDLPHAISKELADQYYQQDQKLMQTKGMQIYEGKTVCADGELREFQFNKAAILNNRGNAIGIIGVMIDITERNRSRRLLELESKRYRDFFASGHIGIYQTTLEGKVVQVNRAFLTMLGYESLKEIQKISAKDLYANPADRKSIIDALSQDGMANRNLILLRKDKSRLKVKAMAKLNGGIIIGYLSETKEPSDKFMIVMCASCFKIRDNKGDSEWISPSNFFIAHREKIKDPDIDYEFSHSICPTCGRELYGEMFAGEDEATNV